MLETSSRVTNLSKVMILKLSFSHSSWISFCPDIDNWIFSNFLVNVLILFDTILTCFGSILGFLWLCLAGNKGTKNIDKNACIIVTNIRNTCTKNTCISSTCTVNIWIRYTGIRNACTGYIYDRNTFVENIKLKALARLGVILTGLGINNCCFWLFIKLIFALIEYINY